jgi:hypothetical protein
VRLRPGEFGDGFAVICLHVGKRIIVTGLIFDTRAEAEKACRKRQKHPNATALGMRHEVAPVHRAGGFLPWAEVTEPAGVAS